MRVCGVAEKENYEIVYPKITLVRSDEIIHEVVSDSGLVYMVSNLSYHHTYTVLECTLSSVIFPEVFIILPAGRTSRL